MADFELHGYLTTGKYQVNDYEIEIERVEGGVELRVTNGNTGVTKVAMIHDGDPVISQDEAATIREMFDQLSVAFPEWQDNEQDRKNAERVRETADQARTNLYNLMKALYDRLYPRIEDDLAAANEAKTAAQAAATTAEAAKNQIINVDLYRLYYHPGETLTIGDSGTADSTSLNASGYCDANQRELHIKIPVAKRLDFVNGVNCDSFKVHIVNTGGYGVHASASSDAGGFQYKGAVTLTPYVDKAQNCIHVKISKSEGTFYLAGNECLSARIGSNANGVPAVKFTFT